MVLVKILGGIDFLASILFMMLVFGVHPFLQITLFCAGLLMLKGMFILTGNILSVLDLIASLILILAIFISFPPVVLWTPALLLMAKAFVSFV